MLQAGGLARAACARHAPRAQALAPRQFVCGAMSSFRKANHKAKHPLAAELFGSGAYDQPNRSKNNRVLDQSKVQIVSESLCDDVLKVMEGSLQPHIGCDLIDMYPGAGLWSRKLHEVLQPRSHILLEPDAPFFEPYLKPLLSKPNTRLLRKSGIVWADLNQVLTPEYLPHQTPRSDDWSEPPKPNSTLLVTANLAFHPKKTFGKFDSVGILLIFQMLASIREQTWFQKYGLVRMLLWLNDDDKRSLLPKTLSRRRKTAMDAGLATEWVIERAGQEAYENITRIQMRPPEVEMAVAAAVAQREREANIRIPESRRTSLSKEVAFAMESSKNWDITMLRTYSFAKEMLESEERFEKGDLDPKSEEWLQTKTYRRRVNTEQNKYNKGKVLVNELHSIAEALSTTSDKDELESLSHRAQAVDKAFELGSLQERQKWRWLRDEQHLARQDPPVLLWDRRPHEPLTIEHTDFLPNGPCTLIDIQPKAMDLELLGAGAHTEPAMTFDVLRGHLMLFHSTVISEAMEALWPGAAEGVLANCPSLREYGAGGMPVEGTFAELTVRALNERQIVEIWREWMKWPFRPTFGELLDRTMEKYEAPFFESNGGAMPTRQF